MRKINLTLTFFLYSILSYIFYIIVFVFVKNSSYESGIYYFTPAFIFVFIKLFESGIKKIISVALFVTVPFLISVYLTLQGHLAGWEVSGFIPVIVLISYLFKSTDTGATPLRFVHLDRAVWMFFATLLLFASIHFIKTGSIDHALYLAVSIYSPAPAAVVTALFINFIISTAAVSAILNNLRFFNNGAKITRLVFDTDRFLTFPHFNLSGIETVKDVSTIEFLELVEKLNLAASESPEYSQNLKKDKLFSKTFEDGMSLAMAPLNIILSNNGYSHEEIALPEKNDDRSFIALARNSKIIGYYAIDRIKPSTNCSYLELIEKRHGIKSVIIAPEEPELWNSCCEIKRSFSETEITDSDLIITDEPEENTTGTQVVWGKCDSGKGDIYIAKPFITTIHNIIILSSGLKSRLVKGIIFCSFPFAFSLFSISFGLTLPKISTVSVLFSFVFTMIYIFYMKPSNRDKGVKK
ncbi:MAG TPA: hypothetical protein PLD55_09050 [bacterium]|nr:hypothetical protein [bacterium]MDX9806107.1 hypothetical protein [bacterium]HNZ54030.1 hypothetical protein [bacterium]HOB70664.1 hypothetical protein [bacterium]HOG43644.1 hypothetical protein [bacterium]